MPNGVRHRPRSVADGIAQPKRIGAWHPRRPAARPDPRSGDGMHAVLGSFTRFS